MSLALGQPQILCPEDPEFYTPLALKLGVPLRWGSLHSGRETLNSGRPEMCTNHLVA